VCQYSCLSYPACKSHSFSAVLYCHLWPLWLYRNFPHFLINGTIFFSFTFHCIFQYTKSTKTKLLKLNLDCAGLLQLNPCDQYLHSVTHLSFVCMQYSLIESISIVTNYIRKKSYKKCRRRLRTWFPDVSVPSKFESWGRSFSNTHSNMQHVKICTLHIRGNVRQLRLPCVWVRFSVKLPVHTWFSWYECNWFLFTKRWPYFHCTGRYTILPRERHIQTCALRIRCWDLLTQASVIFIQTLLATMCKIWDTKPTNGVKYQRNYVLSRHHNMLELLLLTVRIASPPTLFHFASIHYHFHVR